MFQDLEKALLYRVKSKYNLLILPKLPKWQVYYKQVIGINKFGNVPKQIAEFLDLPDVLYTTVLADTGANLTEIKQHGGWKSSTVAEQYTEDSVMNKMKRGQKNLPFPGK
ncbi:hypothetical protein NQ317_000487 [Molorchus minor]|uniref:Peptidase A2 domain-containing protein n=1 Tax=Molorchus minor TaxID=1323400 RepID=A0ABQ9JJH6_9CUCU|nr:hypothetical protein NQ317_000487 [Molorchus minor]